MPVHDTDNRTQSLLGVAGRWTHATTKEGQAPGLWFKQRWISEARPIKGYGVGAEIRAELRFDDECGNGRNSFAITGDITGPVPSRSQYGSRREIAGGCLHDDIAKAFPELARLIPWHLTATDGPMHYAANAVYLAGDRDHYGLRAGEQAPIMAKDGVPHWTLVAVNSLGVAISGTETGLKYAGAETVPLFILANSWKGEEPPVAPRLEWRRLMRTGEGKARDLDGARRAAVWPEATDAELSVEPAALRRVLAERLPGLLARFRADIEAAGFQWAPPN